MKVENPGKKINRKRFTDSFNVDHDVVLFCLKELLGEVLEYFFLWRFPVQSCQIVLGIGIHQQRQTLLKASGRLILNDFIDINLIAELSVQYSSLEAGADWQ